MSEGEKAGAETLPSAIQPIPLVMIGSGTGDGAPIRDGQVIVTPDHQPNFVAKIVPYGQAIAVRAAKAFTDTFLGGMGVVGGGTVTGTLPWATWHAALVFAVGAAIINIGWSCSTIFGDLEKKHPLLTGSI